MVVHFRLWSIFWTKHLIKVFESLNMIKASDLWTVECWAHTSSCDYNTQSTCRTSWLSQGQCYLSTFCDQNSVCAVCDQSTVCTICNQRPVCNYLSKIDQSNNVFVIKYCLTTLCDQSTVCTLWSKYCLYCLWSKCYWLHCLWLMYFLYCLWPMCC